LVAGRYPFEQCCFALDGLLKASGVNYVQGHSTNIDAAAKLLTVDTSTSSTRLDYDVLSIDTEPLMERELIGKTLPGAHEHGFFLRPLHAFPVLWERLQALATNRALRIAVIGAEAASVELAFALRHRFPHCTVTLVCGGVTPPARLPVTVQQRVLRRLKICGINVLPQTCTAIGADHLVLDHVATLVCDAPVLTVASQAPSWLKSSGLSLDEQGFVAVNQFQQSSSHPQVFACGKVAGNMAALHPEGAGDAARAAAHLATNLFAALSGLHLQTFVVPGKRLTFVSCSTRYAIAYRGQWSAQGRWVGYWKDWVDQRLMTRLKTLL
jgi:NADH dehydrogenase FAD-containing subunit